MDFLRVIVNTEKGQTKSKNMFFLNFQGDETIVSRPQSIIVHTSVFCGHQNVNNEGAWRIHFLYSYKKMSLLCCRDNIPRNILIQRGQYKCKCLVY